MSPILTVLLLGSAAFCLLALAGYARSMVSPEALAGAAARSAAEYEALQGARRAVRWAFVVRAGLGILLLRMEWAQFISPDADFYAIAAQELAEVMESSPEGYWLLFSIPTGQGRFQAVNAIVHSLLGSAGVVMVLLAAAVGAWTVLLAARIANRLAGEQAATRVAWLVALFPSLVLWSSLDLRDPFIILAITGAVWATIELKEQLTLSRVLQLLAWLAMIGFLRDYMFVIVAAGVPIAFLLSAPRHVMRNSALAAVIVGAMVFGVQQTGIADFAQQEVSLKDLHTLRQGFTWGANSAYLKDADISTVEGLRAFLPLALIYFLFAPFPWMATGGLQLLTAPEMVFWYLMVPYIWVGGRLTWREHRAGLCVLLAVTFLITFTYALISGNIGTAYRHRAQILPLLLVLAGIGWAHMKARKAAAE